MRLVADRILGIPDAVLGVAEDYRAQTVGCEAVGRSRNDVTLAAKDSVGERKERVSPALQSAGAGSM